MAVSLLQSDFRQKIEQEHKYFLVLDLGLLDVLQINTSRLKKRDGAGVESNWTRAFYERVCRESDRGIDKPAACRESLHRQFPVVSLPHVRLRCSVYLFLLKPLCIGFS
jgi:hypothetical protein